MMRLDPKLWKTSTRAGLAILATCGLLMLTSCGVEPGQSSDHVPSTAGSETGESEGAETPEPLTSFGMGEVEGLTDYVDPASGADASIPGIDLMTWITAREEAGITWLEEGTTGAGEPSEWRGWSESDFSASALSDGAGAMVEFSCAASGQESIVAAIELASTCFDEIDAEGFKASDVNEWAEQAHSAEDGAAYGTARFEVFGPIWMSMAVMPSASGGDTVTFVVRRADI